MLPTQIEYTQGFNLARIHARLIEAARYLWSTNDRGTSMREIVGRLDRLIMFIPD